MKNTDEIDLSFDDWLNKTYKAIEIMSIKFEAADILKQCDPIAYRIYSTDWEDGE